MTIVNPCSKPVAASKPSILPRGLPCWCDFAAKIPQRSEIALVTGKRLPPNQPFRPTSSHFSSSVRFLLGGSSSIPLRISPKHKTLVKSDSGGMDSTQLFTLGCGGVALRLNSESTFVSRRNPFTVQRADRNPVAAPSSGQTRQKAIPTEIGPGSCGTERQASWNGSFSRVAPEAPR